MEGRVLGQGAVAVALDRPPGNRGSKVGLPCGWVTVLTVTVGAVTVVTVTSDSDSDCSDSDTQLFWEEIRPL